MIKLLIQSRDVLHCRLERVFFTVFVVHSYSLVTLAEFFGWGFFTAWVLSVYPLVYTVLKNKRSVKSKIVLWETPCTDLSLRCLLMLCCFKMKSFVLQFSGNKLRIHFIEHHQFPGVRCLHIVVVL